MRLIDADELKKKTYPFPCAIGVEHAVTIRAINDAPTIDPPVKRGEWTAESYPIDRISRCEHVVKIYRCSECGHETLGAAFYCEHCGTSMKNGKEIDADTVIDRLILD